MAKLFKEIRIEEYFNRIESRFKNEIDGFTESSLKTINIDSTVERIFKQFNPISPSLQKEGTTSFIVSKKISGQNFPAGISFQYGKLYDIDIANYKIPFSGDQGLFNCIPKNNSGSSHFIEDAEISNNRIIIELTNWGKITGNNEAIENIKNIFLKRIQEIEDKLTLIKSDVDNFSPILKEKIKDYLGQKVNQAKIKFETNDKLNPFL